MKAERQRMKRNSMLAIDMGASNGRVVWGQ